MNMKTAGMKVVATKRGQGPQARWRQQMDLFASERPSAGGAPVWLDLPNEARAALTGLMATLILDHAGNVARLPSKEVGDDL